MGSDSLPQFSKPTSQLKVSPGTRCQREEDREGQPPGVELTAVATRTRATATAVGSRRATPTPMPTAPPTTNGGGSGFYTSPSGGTKSSGGQAYSTYTNYN